MANPSQQTKKSYYNSQENFFCLDDCLNQERHTYEKCHLTRDGKSVKIVSDGIIDRDKEIQEELKNAGLQNILKLQALRYGTLDNAIVKAHDTGIYADVSKIPTNVGDQAKFVSNAKSKLAALAKELGVPVSELSGITDDKLVELFKNKSTNAAASTDNNQGGAE